MVQKEVKFAANELVVAILRTAKVAVYIGLAFLVSKYILEDTSYLPVINLLEVFIAQSVKRLGPDTPIDKIL